jgi:predicted RNase H-like HicB family nuclease
MKNEPSETFYVLEIATIMQFTATIKKDSETGLYVAWCPELDIASQGESVEEAINNLKEAIELYLEDEDAEVGYEQILISTIEIRRAGI